MSEQLTERWRADAKLMLDSARGRDEISASRFEAVAHTLEACANDLASLQPCSGCAALREALKCFLDDERFQVAIGGNPSAVSKMVTDARKALAQSQPNSKP